MYGAAGWMAAWPALQASGMTGTPSDAALEVFVMSSVIASGASVLPDLDHPDARASEHFGLITKILSKTTNKVAGGHRMATHTILFGLVLGLFTWSLRFWPEQVGVWPAAIVSGMCCSFGLALVGPSLGFRIPEWVNWASALGAGYWVWLRYIDWQLYNLLPWIAVYGVLIHVLCDAVTKGGVPLFWPISDKRIALGIFRVGGTGEQIATVVGIVGFIGALWYASANVVS